MRSRSPLLVAALGTALLVSASTLPAQTGPARPAPGRTPPPAAPTGPDVWNFSTTPGEMTSDGFKEPVLIFRRNERRVAIMTPAGWNSGGSPSELVLINPTLPGARISFRKSSLPVPKEFDAEWGNTLRQVLLASVPKAAKNGQVTAMQNQPLSVNGWKTYEGRCSFDLAGERYVWDYVFIRIHAESMVEAIVVAREIDFPKVRKALLDILPTWQDMPVDRRTDGAKPPAAR